jgi:hypothetical protein
MAERSRIIKVAGMSLLGFCVVSAAADKLPHGINTSQIAGFCGAFAGALVGRYRRAKHGRSEAGKNQLTPSSASPDAPESTKAENNS